MKDEEKKEESQIKDDVEAPADVIPLDEADDSKSDKTSDIEKRERDVNLREFLVNEKLDSNLFQELDGFDFEQSKRIIGLLSKRAKELAKTIAQEQLKKNGFSPNNKTSETIKSYGEMSIKERIALKKSNPELYETLFNAYRDKIGG